MSTKPTLIEVRRVEQSPTNPKRWVLELACGHDAWVSAVTRPTREKTRCETCARTKREAKF